ncbi:MAG: YraN family protein [Clostridia bacterium]|nr:YraN family protein [Clostridia bacterium]
MPNSQKDFYKKLLGISGEQLTARRLKRFGYKILQKNYVTPFGEADIIAKKGEQLFFVEVKTRSSLKYGAPSEAVNYKKQQKYINIANYYLQQNDLFNIQVSFMVAEVLKGKVNLITDAF